jgi:hypothetical protein
MSARGRWSRAWPLLLGAVGGGAIGCGGGHPVARPALGDAAVQLRDTIVHRLPPARLLNRTLWDRGSWCWFGDPRAVHVGGRDGATFAGWIDWRGRITIGEYRPGRPLRTRVIGRLAVDDHGSPSILVEPSRRLTVFWSGHGGPTMFYRTTRRPLDISSWGAVRRIRSDLRGPKGFTYPNPVLLSGEANRLYLFWRGADWSQDYETRTAGGRWSPARRLIAVAGERPYVKVGSDGRGAIAFAFTDGHPRSVTTSIYFTEYRDGALQRADGQRIATLDRAPISARQADVVYDARRSGIHSWVWDVALAPDGRPVIVYATFPSPLRHEYWYATWTGSRWVSHFLTVAGPTIAPNSIEKQYSGGIELDHADPSTVYLSREVAGSFEIERWHTDDWGGRWSYQTVVRTPGSDDLRPVVPRGSATGGIPLLWLQGRYRGYKSYRTRIAFAR